MSDSILYTSIFIQTCSCCVILETVLLRSHEVPTLVLSHLDVPGPGGGGGGRVDVDVDGHARVTGGDPHVLSGIVATDDWWGSIPRDTDYGLIICIQSISI